MPYYEHFTHQYPTIHDLAKAESQDVMKTWEGLGYYSRARNLHATAKYISEELNGIFPSSYEQLVKLKGVGPYTAAAIASIAFGEASPVVDGNVFRFISRHFGVEKDIADQKNRKYFMEILEELIPHDQPGVFNQAVMEFGATVCTPSPNCSDCIFRTSCYAFANRKQQELPIKSKKVKVKEQFISYLVIRHEDQVLVKQRTESIWHGLFEFPSLAGSNPITNKQLQDKMGVYDEVVFRQSHEPLKHLLTHRKLWVSFHDYEIKEQKVFNQVAKDFGFAPYRWEEILTLPFPKVILNHLQRVGF